MTEYPLVRLDRLDALTAALAADGSTSLASVLASLGVGSGGGGTLPSGVPSVVRQSPDGSWLNPARAGNAGPRVYVGTHLPATTVGAQVRDLAFVSGVLWEMASINVWRNHVTGETQQAAGTGGGTGSGDTSTASAVVVPFAQLGAEGTWTTTGNVSVVAVLADASSSSTATGVPTVDSGAVSLTLDMRNFAHVVGNDVGVTLDGVASNTTGEVAVSLLGGGVLIGTKTLPLVAGQMSARWLAAELPTRSSWVDVEVRVTRSGGNLVLGGVTAQSLTPSGTTIPPGVVLDAALAKANAGSSWYQTVAYGTPATDSVARVAALAQQVTSLRFGAYTGTPVWIATSATPRLSVALDDAGRGSPTLMRNASGTGVLDAVPIPASAVPSDNAAKTMAVWAADSSQLWELLGVTRSAQGAWSAQWGGRIDNLPASTGVHAGTLGFTGSGLSQALAAVKISEVAEGLRTGRIDTIRHAVGVVLPATAAGSWSWPAVRTNGTSTAALAVRQGQRLRVPPTFDVAGSNLSPVGKMVAWAAQNYGFVVVGEDVQATVLAESGEPQRVATGVNPWDTLLSGVTAQSALAGFPIASLQVMPTNFGQDGQLGTPTPQAGAKTQAILGSTRSGLAWFSGVWTGSPHQATRPEGFGTWRARPTDAVMMYVTNTSEATMRTSDFNVSVYNAFGGRLAYTVTLVPADGGFTLADVAGGAKDTIWSKIASDLVANGRGNAIVRVGWDINGGTAAHQGTAANATTWKNAYRKVVQVMRGAAPNLRFVWAANAGAGVSGSGDRLAAFNLLYPGDDVVDIVGLDVYDRAPTAAVDNTEWAANVLAPAAGPGLTDLRTFAVAHDKGMAVPEWGLYNRDNGYYPGKMFEWFDANDDYLVLEHVFNEDGAPFFGSVYDPNQRPLAAATYQTAWSAGVVTPPPPAPNPEPVGGVMAFPTNAVEVYKKMYPSDGPQLSAISNNADVIILSFATQHTGRLRLVGYGAQGKTSLVSEIKAKRAAGVRVTLGIGGGGNPINVGDVNGFVADVKWIIDDLGVQLDGLDWDIEHNADPLNVGLIGKALFDHYGPNFKSQVTVGGINNEYDRDNRIQQGLQLQQRGCLSRFSHQCYDWTGWGAADWYAGILKPMYQSYISKGFSPDVMSLGMRVGPEPSMFPQAKCQQAMTQLKADLGVHKCTLWIESNDGPDVFNTWASNMRTILGA